MCYLTLSIFAFEPFCILEQNIDSFFALQIYENSSTLPTFIEKKCYPRNFSDFQI